MRDSAGVTLVHNAQHSVPTGCIVVGATPTVSIAPTATTDSGAPLLNRVWGGARLDDGTIVLLNAGSQQLLFFSAKGAYLRAAGRQGRGPGEFVAPDWLGHAAHDSLFVWDTRLGRLSLFSGDGTYLTSRRVLDQLPTVRGRFDDGSLLLEPISMVQVRGDGRVERNPRTYQRYDPRTEGTNRLADGLSDEWVDGEGGPYALPFGKGDFFAANGPWFVLGDNGISAVRFYDEQGALRRVVTWVSDPIPVTGEDKRVYAEHQTENARPGGRPRRATLFAEVRPRFSALEVDRIGWLWVHEYAADWEPPAAWLIFDERGVLQCRVEMPARVSVLEIGRDYLLGRQENEVDEESVVLFEVRRR